MMPSFFFFSLDPFFKNFIAELREFFSNEIALLTLLVKVRLSERSLGSWKHYSSGNHVLVDLALRLLCRRKSTQLTLRLFALFHNACS